MKKLSTTFLEVLTIMVLSMKHYTNLPELIMVKSTELTLRLNPLFCLH